MYARILVPVESGEGMTAALQEAMELARAHDATIHLIHVVRTTGYTGAPMEGAWTGIARVPQEEGEAIISPITERLENANIPYEAVIREGIPSREIVRYATETGCDLIVMCSQQRLGLDRLLLGSVTERVVRRAPMPVLTITQRANSTEELPLDPNTNG